MYLIRGGAWVNIRGGGKETSGVKGAAPPAGSRGRAPWWGSGGEAKPPEAEAFLVIKS